MKIFPIVAATVFAAAISTPAVAANHFDERVYLNVAAGWAHFDHERQFSDNNEFHYGAELRFLPNWAAELNYTRGQAKAKGASGRDKYTEVRLDGLYYFNDNSEGFQPYLAGGVGHAEFEATSHFGARDEVRLNIGGGTRLIVDDGFSLRAGVRGFYSPRDGGLVDAVVTVGASLAFSLNR